jgi:uroporphyrinogen-III synthase
MIKPIHILSTKTLLPHQKQLLLDAQIGVEEVDFITTKAIDFELGQVHDHLIFTSQNSVQAVLQHPNCDLLKTKNVFCVGLKTKSLLEENGFNVLAYTGYAADLAEIISLIYGKESYTFFCGNLRRDELPNILKENGVLYNEIKVYETTLTPQKIKQQHDGVLFFSPSAVESYLKSNTIKEEMCFCIGETTTEALVPKLRDNKIKNRIIAAKPTMEQLILDVIAYYNSPLAPKGGNKDGLK